MVTVTVTTASATPKQAARDMIGCCRIQGGRSTHWLLAVSHLTIDHASLSRRSAPRSYSLQRHLQHLGAPLRFFFFHILHRKKRKKFILSRSCIAVCGHHLSTRIAIAFSSLSWKGGRYYSTIPDLCPKRSITRRRTNSRWRHGNILVCTAASKLFSFRRLIKIESRCLFFSCTTIKLTKCKTG